MSELVSIPIFQYFNLKLLSKFVAFYQKTIQKILGSYRLSLFFPVLYLATSYMIHVNNLFFNYNYLRWNFYYYIVLHSEKCNNATHITIGKQMFCFNSCKFERYIFPVNTNHLSISQIVVSEHLQCIWYLNDFTCSNNALEFAKTQLKTIRTRNHKINFR